MTVYTSKRTFDSIQDLIASATPELDAGLIIDAMQTYWWYGDRVKFESNTSAAMVEVDGQKVLLGYPAFYKTYEFEDGESALYWAWQQHQEWVEWQKTHSDPEDWREFIKQAQSDLPPIAIWASRHPYRIVSRRELAATVGWDADGQWVANVWNLLTQGKGVRLLVVLPSEDTPSNLLLLPITPDAEFLTRPAVDDVVDLSELYV